MSDQMDFVTLHLNDGKTARIPREWMDERDAEKKEREIARATAEAAIRNNPMTREEVLSKFIDANDYRNSDEYKSASKIESDLSTQREKLSQHMQSLRKQIDQESKLKPKSKWNEEDEFNALIGKRPREYTEKGKELQKEYDKVFKKYMEVDDKWSEAGEKTRAIKEQHARQEKKWWEESRPKMIHGDANKEYVGFATKTRSGYDADLARGKGYIAEMPPKEYLQRITYDCFGSTWSSVVSGVKTDNILIYAQMMKNGVKMDMPSMKPGSPTQEGRHRAMAAYLCGIEKIPVYIIPD